MDEETVCPMCLIELNECHDEMYLNEWHRIIGCSNCIYTRDVEDFLEEGETTPCPVCGADVGEGKMYYSERDDECIGCDDCIEIITVQDYIEEREDEARNFYLED